MKPTQILFVCLGNICRSPSAETVMNEFLKKEGLNTIVKTDSAGLIDFHAGEPADSRSRMHAQKRGYRITHLSRQIIPKIDFELFDMIICMDAKNMKELRKIAPNESGLKKLFLMTDFRQDLSFNHVPDPYYGGADDFELVLDILEDSCKGLIKHIRLTYLNNCRC